MTRPLPKLVYMDFANYRKRGNFHWAKLLRYPQYMDFHGNTFAVQGQGPIP